MKYNFSEGQPTIGVATVKEFRAYAKHLEVDLTGLDLRNHSDFVIAAVKIGKAWEKKYGNPK